MKKEHVAFIIKSGREQKLRLWMSLAEETFEVSRHVTRHEGHATLLTVEAINAGAHKIVAVGGDGTLHEVINGILGSENPKTPVLFLPAGTGNDWGRTLPPPKTAEEFTARLQNDPAPVDVGKISWEGSRCRYFINVADSGMGAEVVKKVGSMKLRVSADIKFLLAILQVFMHFKNEAVECFVDGKNVYSGQARSVVIANGKSFGSGLRIAPDARPDDGQFEIVVIGDVSIFEYLKYIPALKAGKVIHHPRVRYFSGTDVVVRTDKFQTEADGEWVLQGPARFTLINSGIMTL